MRAINLAILVSGGGTTLANFVDRIADGSLNARIVLVIASRPGIKAIDRANNANLPCEIVERKQFATIEAFSDRIFSLCQSHGAELVCLSGWLSLIKVPDAWMGRVMNIHPALLPKYGGKGMFGHHVHEAVVNAKEAQSGCTVHFVNNEYDSGPIILQRTCDVNPGDTPKDVARKVFEQEKIAYPEAVQLYQAGTIKF